MGGGGVDGLPFPVSDVDLDGCEAGFPAREEVEPGKCEEREGHWHSGFGIWWCGDAVKECLGGEVVDGDRAVICAGDGEECVWSCGRGSAEAEVAEVESVDGKGVEKPRIFSMS